MRVSRLAILSRAIGALLLAVLMLPVARAQDRAKVEVLPSLGHADEIAAAAFSPDGTRVLSADRNGTMKLWDAASGRLLQSFAGEREYSPKLVFSRDGTVAVSLRSGSLTLWNVATGQAIRTIAKLPIRTTSVAFAPDGKSVLLGATNGTAQLRDLESGRITQVFPHIHASASGNISVAFSPDGTLVLTGGGRGGRDKAADDRRVKAWEAATGRLVRAFGEFGEYSDEVELAVSPDGARVAVADHQYNVVQIWDIATGKGLKALAGRRPTDGGIPDWRAMQFVAFSRDGTLVVSGGLGWVRAWDAGTGNLVHALGEDSMRRPEHGYFHAVSPDGTLAVSGGLTLTLWDVTKGEPVRDLVGLSHPVAAVAASPGGERVLSVGLGGTFSLWDVATGMPVQQGRLEDGFRSVRGVGGVAFLRKGPRAVVRYSLYGTLELWDTDKAHKILSLEGSFDRDTPVAISPDGARIVAGGRWLSTGTGDRNVLKKPVTVWDAATGEVVHSFEEQDKRIYAFAFSPDGNRLVSGGERGSVVVWDLRTRSLLRAFDTKPEQGRWSGDDLDAITAVAFSPDGGLVLSAGHAGARMKLWESATGQLIRSWEAQPLVRSLAFSPDGRQIVSAGGDTKIQLWDVATGRLVHTFAGHAADVASVAFSHDGRRIFSGSRDGTAGVWDPASGRLLATMVGREGGAWLTVTPEGFFAGSAPAAAIGVLSIARGFDTFGIDPFIETLHRPDLVREKLRSDPDGKVKAAAATLDLDKVLDSGGAPNLAVAQEIRVPPQQGARAVELIPQMGHSSSIAALAFSPDGRFAASASNENTVKLWDVATGRELRTFKGHSRSVKSVAFSPDGRLLLSGSEDTALKLWDAATGQALHSFTGHRDAVVAAAFSPDGRFALSAESSSLANAGAMKLWAVATGKALRTFKGHSEGIESVAFSPDGRLALSGGKDKRVKLWELSSGQELRSFDRHSDRVHSVAFSPDGRLILSGSDDKTMRLWDAATGMERRSFAHDSGVTSVAFAADGRFAISGISYDSLRARDGSSTLSSLERVRVWDVTTGAELRKFVEPGGQIDQVHLRIVNLATHVALSGDGRFALSNRGDAMLLWDVATGKLLRPFAGYSDSVRFVAFSPDGRLMISDSGGTMHLWDTTSGKDLRSFGKVWHGTAAAFSADGRFVLTGTHGDFERRMMDTPAGKAIALSPDGRLALSASGWTLKLWETATGKEVRSFGSETPSTKVDNTVTLWDVATGQELHRFVGHQQWVTSVAFSPDGRRALSGARDSTMKLWDVATGKELRSIAIHGVSQLFFVGAAVSFLLDGSMALSAGSGGLEAWNLDTGKQLGAVSDPSGSLGTVAFSADGRLAASSSAGNTIKLWDMTTGKELRTFVGHASRIESVAISSDGRFVLSGSGDGTARLWNAANGQELVRMMAGPFDEWLTMTPQGFFSGSRRDTAMLAIVRGLEATTTGQIYQSLFNPDLVREALGGDADGEVKRAAQVVNLEKVLDSGPPPNVDILSPTPGGSSSRDLVTVAARLTDRGKGIGRIEWRINGVTAGVASAPEGSGPVHDVKQTLALDPGENRIEVIAYERRNVLASVPARTTIRFSGPADAAKPSLHVLAIGINAYIDKGGRSRDSKDYFPPLSLAVADAKALAAGMRKAGAGLYSKVHVTEALDTAATAANLDRIIGKMSARVSPRDTFVLFAAAHGMSRDGRFYLIPQDYQGGTDPKALADRAIGQDRLQEWVANRITARKAIILLDTCESGALVSGYTMSRTDMPASEAAVGRLHEATGRPVLTAAASGKPAFEGYRGHGVFTFALLDALRHGDSSANGLIEVSELVAHVQDHVPKLSAELNGRGISMIAVRGSRDDRQSAHFGSTGEDFPLVRRLQGARGKARRAPEREDSR